MLNTLTISNPADWACKISGWYDNPKSSLPDATDEIIAVGSEGV